MVAVGLALVAAAVSSVVYTQIGYPAADVWFQVVSWGALFVAWRRVRRHCLTPLPWLLILLGYAMFAVGDALFSLYEVVLERDPFPSIADFVYLAAYVPLCTGLMLLVRGSSAGVGRVVLVDAGIAVIPAFVAAWIYLMAPLAAETDSSVLDRLVSIAYPIGDLVCLAVVVRLLTGINLFASRRQPALFLLLAAIAVTLAADTAFVWLTLSGVETPLAPWFDSAFMFSPIALAAAASTASIAHVADPATRDLFVLSRRRLMLLALAALMTPTVLLVQWINSADLAIPLVVAGTALSFLLVIARMAGLVAALEESHSSLQFDATHDLLTALPNRHRFTRHLHEVLDQNRPGALLFIDLDRFKAVNDTLGHSVGDDVLVEIARHLRESVRADDLVGRLAGDEFVVLVDSADDREVQGVAERLQQRLRVHRTAGDQVLRVTASIGMVRWPAGTPSSQAGALFAAADRAMYAAKAAASLAANGADS